MATKKVKSINQETKETHQGDVLEGERVLGKEGVWESAQAEVRADTKLTEDKGQGRPIILRSFEFGAKPGAFKDHIPSKQELFNAHFKQIEIILWQDGLTAVREIEPKLQINKKKTHYRIWVAATPQRGAVLVERPKTLSQIANARQNI